jgi:hypothetical protein
MAVAAYHAVRVGVWPRISVGTRRMNVVFSALAVICPGNTRCVGRLARCKTLGV